jgi:hypothetical protein
MDPINDQLMDILPIENKGATMDPFFFGPGLETQEAFPEVINYNATTFGWEASINAAWGKQRSASFNKSGVGTVIHTFSPKDGYPVQVLGVIGEFTTNDNERQGNIRVDIETTFFDGSTMTHYWEGQFKALDTRLSETRLVLGYYFSVPVLNSKLTAAAPTVMQRYVPIVTTLADSVNDPEWATANGVDEIKVTITTSTATLMNSFELVTPGSDLWDIWIESLLTSNIEEIVEDYSTNRAPRNNIFGFKL